MERPRRSTRQPAKAEPKPSTVVAPQKGKGKAKPANVSSENQLENLLCNPKSELTKIDISNIFNVNVWNALSPESQAQLLPLLPDTAFLEYQPHLGPEHPSSSSQTPPTQIRETLDPSVFTDAHFLSAAHTWQDHIFSGWTSEKEAEKVRKYQDGVRDGTLSAPWKDEEWERENGGAETRIGIGGTGTIQRSVTDNIAGPAAELKLTDLANSSVLLPGDILSYKRHFPTHSPPLTIQKDALIASIHPSKHTLTLFFEPGTSKSLPSTLLRRHGRAEPSPPTQIAEGVSSPGELENLLLDADGRIERGARPNGNAWKCFTVWRWRDEEFEGMNVDDDEYGGRENHGTLFYLRGCFYQDR